MTESNPLSDSTPGGASFRCAPLIKEIGRGARGARALSHDDAYALYAAMLDGRVSDVELGAVVLAYRVKGETPQELAAMLAAAQASLRPLATRGDRYRPVSIPSYNGARKQPNLTPLLALLLARRGVPVLVHGVTVDPGRVTSAEIFAELDLPAARSIDEIDPALAHARVAFAPIDVLAPKMSRLLGLRATLGVRNTTHTLVKLLQPFAEPGLRLVNYTHPAYRDSLSALFHDFPQAAAGGVLLARGTEGEAAADTQRRVQVDWLHDQVCETLVDTERASPEAPVVELPDALDAATTARWITDVLNGRARAPEAIVRQVELIERVAQWKESGQAPCA
jgi:anthranilate phosphoribosyltransferase